MNKKLVKNVLFCAFLALLIIFAPRAKHFAETITNEDTQSATSTSSGEEGDEFNFIKSDKYDGNFFYSDNWLLYGGIILIIVSITGIVITIKPRKKRQMRNNRRNTKSK